MLSMYRVRAGGISCRGLKENVAALPSPVGVKRITFPSLAHTIEPMPGKMASVAIYSHLSDKHGGRITKQAAREALDLYAEVVDDARAHRGSHPNIDLLLDLLGDKEEGAALEIVIERT